MVLHNTDTLILATTTAGESLPDPTLVNGRTHDLCNTHTASAVWSSTGATPFMENGLALANVSVARGQSKRVQSDGVRWVVIPGVGRRMFAGNGVTDAAGNITFNFAPAFTAAPIVTHAVQTAITDVTECRVSAVTAASVTFNVRRSPAVVILGISVLQVPIPAAGVTVHCCAVDPGQT